MNPKIAEFIYIFGYYIFGWVVATGNVITENVKIILQCLNLSIRRLSFPALCCYAIFESNCLINIRVAC